MDTVETKKEWFKPSQIVKDGLILDLNGKPNYRYILRLIKSKKLPAKVWTYQDGKPYYVVHINDIEKFNAEGGI